MSVVKAFGLDNEKNKRVDQAIENSCTENLAMEKANLPQSKLQNPRRKRMLLKYDSNHRSTSFRLFCRTLYIMGTILAILHPAHIQKKTRKASSHAGFQSF